MASRDAPPDSVAFRRELVAGFGAFFCGFGLAAALFVFLYARSLPPGGPSWWTIVNGVVSGLMASFLAGGAFAVATVNVLQRWHYWRGVYKCVYCGRALRRGPTPCVCWADPGHPMAEHYASMLRRHHPPRLRHYRKRLGRVLLAYSALVPVAMIFVLFARHPRRDPLPGDVVNIHILLCVFAVVVIAMVTTILEALSRARRFRLRAEAFLRAFALWPLIAAFGMAALTFFGVR